MLHAKEVGLSELNFGNNFFSPECLYKLCEAAHVNTLTLSFVVPFVSKNVDGWDYYLTPWKPRFRYHIFSTPFEKGTVISG